MDYLILVLGLVLLIKGADWMVDGAGALASRFGVSDLTIGLTVVALGTSAPELVVNLISSFNGAQGVAVGNVLGSNIANVLLVLGVVAFLGVIRTRKVFSVDMLFALAVAPLLLLIVWLNQFLGGSLELSRIGALFLLVFFGFFFYRSLKIPHDAEEDEIHHYSLGKSWAFTLVGLAALIGGGDLLVRSAVSIARSYGISEDVIGLTIVAIGTSLPEVAASATAALKGKGGMALGNVLGSNVFNIAWVLGVSALIRPLEFTAGRMRDGAIAGGVMIFLILLFIIPQRYVLNRFKGILLLLAYAISIWYLAF